MIRAVLVDDHPGMRQVIRWLLERSGEVEVVGEAGDGEQALRAIEEMAPDVVILDVVMSPMDGFKVMAALNARTERPEVVMISMNDSSAVTSKARRVGAAAFVPKKEAHMDLLPAVRAAVEA